MAKDPFENIPKLQEEQGTTQSGTKAAAATPEVAAIAKSSAPRNLLKNLQKWGVLIVTLGVGVWLMIPSSTPKRPQKTAEQPVEIDPTRQVSDTNTLMNSLKEQAKKEAPPANAQPVAGTAAQGSPVSAAPIVDALGNPMPPQQGPSSQVSNVPTPVTPLPSPSPFAMSSPSTSYSDSGQDSKAKRLEEIRAAPIAVQGLKLRTSGDMPTTPKLTALQEELAAVSASKDAATRAQIDLLNRTGGAASQVQQPTGRSRSTSEDFLAREGDNTAARRPLQIQVPVSKFIVQENTAIRAVLLSGVSSDLPGKVSAMVTSDVYDSIYRRYVMIPKGSTLIGVYSSEVVVGQEALLIAMTRLILPNGNWIALGGAPATNMIGRSGLNAEVNNHFWKMFGSSFVIGASSLLLPKQQSTVSTTTNGAGSVTTGSAAALAMSDALSNMMSRNKSMAPTLTASSGAEFLFLVSQDMAMTPYKP